MTIHHAPNRTSKPGRGKTRSLRLLSAALITPMIAVPLAAAGPVSATAPVKASAAPVAANAADTEPTAIESAHLDATDAAKESGIATPIDGLTTGQSQVLAEPDGSFTMTSSPETVRVEENGEWQPIDTRLVRNADGTLSPARAAVDLTFSGGGEAPMLEIANDENQSIGFTWPKALPEPTLDGNVATYAEVLPGVDLKLVAYADSFGEVLVVKNAEAAANPALRRLTLGTVSRGLELTKNAQGGLAAVDGNGDAAFSGPAPYMWDSTNKSGSPAPSAEDSDSGQVTEIGLSVDQATDKATLTPPAAALSGPDVDYPVYIDPSMSGQSDDTKAGSHELTVHEAGWDYFNDPVQPLRVGYCGWYGGDSNCNDAQQLKSRSYFSFYINDLQLHDDVEIFSAKVTAKQLHVANCNSPQPTELWSADNFSQSADQHWPGPRRTKLQTDSGACSGSFLTYGGWSAGDPVKDYVKSSVAAGQTAIQFNVSAANESDRNQWKKLDSPELEVMYNFRPGEPYGLTVDGARECPGQQRYVYDDTPILESRAYNYERSVGIEYEILRASDNAPVRWSNDPLLVGSDSVAKWYANGSNTNNQSPIPDGTYRMRARSTTLVTDGTNLKSDYTTSYTYILDTVNPTAPVVSSFDYPREYWGATSATPGNMIVKGSSETRAFIYSIDTSGGQSIPDVRDCSLDEYKTTQRGLANANSDGDASFQLAQNLSPGPHTLYVKAIDKSGRVSAQSTGYTFYVAPTIPGAGATRTNPKLSNAPGPIILNRSVSTAAASDFHQVVATQGTVDTPSTVELKFDTTLDAADYALGLGMIETSHHGKVRFLLDGKEMWINDARVQPDTSNATARPSFVQLGGAHLTKGEHTLRIEIFGTSGQNFRYNGTYDGTNGNPVTLNNVDDNGYSIGIDYLIRVPINNVTYASFTNALNNNGIEPLGTAANIGPSSGHSGIPLEALTAKQMAPGSVRVIDGVAFKMPAEGPDGDDNVVAMGQTIKLDEPVTAKKVHLLVNASCRPVPLNARVAINVNHVHPNPTPEEPVLARYFRLPKVPAWMGDTADPTPSESGVSVKFGAEVDYYSAGGTKYTTSKPTFYHMEIPVAEADWQRPIESITLPNTGTVLDDICNVSALHVYSIATTN